MYNCSYDRNCDFGCGTCNTYGRNCEGNCNCNGNLPLYDTESTNGIYPRCCCCCAPDIDAEVAELYACLEHLPKGHGTAKRDCGCNTYCCGWTPWGYFNICLHNTCGNGCNNALFNNCNNGCNCGCSR